MIRHGIALVSLPLLLLAFSVPVQADAYGNRQYESKRIPKKRIYKTYRKKGYLYDKAHRHNRYYPKYGHRINRLPRRHRIVSHHNHRYYFSGGVWYRPMHRHFVVVRPPIGLFTPILPPYYTTLYVDSVPYYYAGGVYYVWNPARSGYVVSRTPEKPAQTADAQSSDPFIYPKNNQSEERQATDRYECHRWSRNQTGFDPTREGGNVSPTSYPQKRNDYFRAMRACLEGRHYSVR